LIKTDIVYTKMIVPMCTR